MHREQQHAGFKSDRQNERREWGHGGRKEQHQMESREHAPPGKVPVTRQSRAVDLHRQAREIRD